MGVKFWLSFHMLDTHKATAEQIRLAQMISDHNDADFEEKVKQLIDITGKNQDECVIALHDCNGDVNRAINVLLEGNPDTHSWEMVGKKKGVSGQKDGGQTESNEEGKENRDRDRDYSRRRGGPPRRGRGASRGRELIFLWDLSISLALYMLYFLLADLKSANDSTVHSPFTKRQAFTPSSTMMEVFLQEKPPAVATSTAAPPPPSSPLPSKSTSAPQMSPGSSDNQSSSPQPAQQKLKQQKKKTSLTSKIPALAVEMPGSADISGLNLQFGALQFGSEPVLSDYESTPTTSASSSQAPSSLYTSTASESSSTVSSNQSQESGYQSGPIQSTTYTSQNNAQGPLYEQRSTQTRRYPSSISSSPQKDLTQAKVAPTSSKQHGVNVSVNASATPFQQPSGYGSHGYNTGVSVTSSNTGVPDISGSVYSKTQTGSGQRSQTSSIPQKPQTNKSAYNSYSWGAN
ncbi:Ubiquitin-associated protein 2-like [Cricetulus griseus]|uniref:Ubiquitin-associated protein 2-like n=1 Tax=Cricetulus griseus TaxID=10029 RepID=G3HBZ8_CRIGR|nr:Ubiquitin-associated protein 2-like [Cricetulus griseus]